MRRFGDVFTLRMAGLGTGVAVADPAAIKQIFTADPAVLQAGESNSFLEPLVGKRSVLLLDGPEHMRQRRLLLPAFHGERMQRYGELIREIVERDLDCWPTGTPLALRPRMQAITLEVIMRAVFGIREAGRLLVLRQLLEQLTDTGRGIRWIGMLIPALQRDLWPGSPWRKFVAVRDKVDAVLYDEIARRRDDPALAEREDILSLLLQARDEDGEPMSDIELRDELITLLVAGHETTATALSWAFELLLASPHAMARLEQEQETVDDDERYLDAVIKETLRLRPVLPIVSRLLKAPFEVAGHRLPEGVVVAPCIYLTHRRADVYPEPERFVPERFLDHQPDTYAWLPFGGGIRRCIGASFAIFEMRVVIPAVLERFQLSPVGRKPEPVRRRAISFIPGREGLVTVAPRKTRDQAAGPPPTMAEVG